MESCDLYVFFNGEWLKIEYREVVFIQANHNYSTVVTKKCVYHQEISLARIIEIVDPAFYLQVHRSYIIPCHSIRAVSRDTVRLTDREVPVGKTFLPLLLAKLPLLK